MTGFDINCIHIYIYISVCARACVREHLQPQLFPQVKGEKHAALSSESLRGHNEFYGLTR